MTKELDTFDWFTRRDTTHLRPLIKEYISNMHPAAATETRRDRQMRMLRQMDSLCLTCSMCDLGLVPATKNGISRDPHVFSNLNPSPFMIVGQNPGWDETEQKQPFVGAAGKKFDKEITKHGLSRNDFYIGNSVRCFTAGNARPTAKHKERCEPFLQIELNILRPKLVITLGAVAFSQFCPQAIYAECLKKITKSEGYGVPVFAIYHPSPLNLSDSSREEAFDDQIKVLCQLIKALRVGASS